MDSTRPTCVESDEQLEEYLDFLDGLRDSGVTNMLGAGAYIRELFNVSRKDATEILTYWMGTFSERHKE